MMTLELGSQWLLLPFGAGVISLLAIWQALTAQAAPASTQQLSRVNFRVEIDGTAVPGIKEVSGIAADTEVIEFRESDDLTMHKRPGRTKYANLTLQRGFIADDSLRQWYDQIRRGVAERKSVSVIILDRAGAEAGRYNFFEAWPCQWEGPVLSSGNDTQLVERIQICIERWEVK